MGARGRLAAFLERVPVLLSEAQKYKLKGLADRHGNTLTGVVRGLIDEKWEQENGCDAP